MTTTNTVWRRAIITTAVVAAVPASIAVFNSAYAGDDVDSSRSARPTTFQLTGDSDGSKFEGIATDQSRGIYYVSEVTGGEIHRGTAKGGQAEEWLMPGQDGRNTARGIAVDDHGLVYIAGGPNGTGNDLPGVWVYTPDGQLLAALDAPANDAFFNDVVIGPDGAAYFTNSTSPQVFRVANDGGAWGIELFADGSGTIATTEGFNLGGLVVSPDKSALVVAQGTNGALWRVGLDDGSISQVETGGETVVDADGLVLSGTELTVVQNFSQQISTFTLAADGSEAELQTTTATSPERVLTTAAVLNGQILYVDSHFDEETAAGPYEVVTDPQS